MKILKVIHGFPPDYMAGSEVYSYNLVKELSKTEEVFVFTRVENEFDSNYKIYNEVDGNIKIRRINNPERDYNLRDKYFNYSVEEEFEKYLNEVKPDVVHIGHLSHLSTNIVKIVKKYSLPIIFTIHDFWMFCIKGQLINQFGERCDGPTPEKCQNCSKYLTNLDEIKSYFKHMKETINLIDIFVSPSKYLIDFFVRNGVEREKIIFSKYGFDKNLINVKKKNIDENTVIKFGFMGRIIPTKGIKVLISAFKDLPENELYIFGGIGNKKRFLEISDNIVFKGSYNNSTLNEVLSSFDVLIVPSIWVENAPLVIQEAFIANVPVITSNIGGMKELVKDGINGYTFEVGDSEDLKRVIKTIVSKPTILNQLKIDEKEVVDIKDEAQSIIRVYHNLLKDRSDKLC